MKDIAVVGGEKFRLGFQIAGLTKAFKLNEEYPDHTIKELMDNPEIGLILLSQNASDKLSDEMKEQITQSVEPVFLIISEGDSSSDLRKLIKKSIGVDLWEQ
ncbi:MAG: V-type ATP synthase subunit F [Candidatus Nanoarchaeia archaeon]